MDIIIQHKNVVANDENTIYDYTSMPPPPYSKSTSSHHGATRFFKPKQAIEATNSILLTASNVKDYIARLKDISPILMNKSDTSSTMRERNIATTTTDSYTENTQPNIHEPNASSSSPFIEQNKRISESSTMNDSLERIGTSLQLLIEEAQASLLTTSTQQSQQPQETETIVDYSYRYVQHGYLQSQEKLALAIEKLEQSIHSVVYTASMQQQTIKNYYTTTHHHHHYAATTYPSSSASVSSSSQPPPSFDRSKLWIMGMVLIFIGCSLQPYYKVQHAKTSILLLLLANKSQTAKRIISWIDRLVIHLTHSHHLPLIKFTHNVNIAICVTKVLFLSTIKKCLI